MGQRVYRAVIRSFVAVFTLLGLRFDVRGAEHVPRTGPAVLAINHTSYLDFDLVGFALRGRPRPRPRIGPRIGRSTGQQSGLGPRG